MVTWRPDPGALQSVAMTVALGVAGGLVFDALGLPAAYLSGSMLAVGIAAIAGLNVSLPMPLRDLAFVVLGTVLGSTIDQDTIASLPAWPISLLMLVVCLGFLVTIVPYYLMRVHGFDRWTAKLCAIPGALSIVVALASDLSADVRRVAVVQTSRLAVLMIFIPVLAGVAAGVEPPMPQSGIAVEWLLIAAIFAICVVGVVVARLLRLPTPFFIGPLLVSGAVFGSGLVEGQMPPVLLWPALVVVGASVGARFHGTNWRFLADSLKAGFGGTVLSIVLTGLFAYPVAHFLSLPVIQIWLAFAPGGFEAMTVLAFALGVDPAFVAGHQLFRFIVISFALPFLFRGAVRPATGK